MSDLSIQVALTADSFVTFVRGELKNSTGVVVDTYDAPTIHGHLAEDFLFREPGEGSYTLECSAYGQNGQLIEASVFIAGPIQHDQTTSQTVAVTGLSVS